MAYKKINAVYFIADSKDDLKNLPESPMGAECYVIKEACEYKCTSDNNWYKQVSNIGSSSGGSVDLTGYATEDYVDEAISKIEELIALTKEEILNICKP